MRDAKEKRKREREGKKRQAYDGVDADRRRLKGRTVRPVTHRIRPVIIMITKTLREERTRPMDVTMDEA